MTQRAFVFLFGVMLVAGCSKTANGPGDVCDPDIETPCPDDLICAVDDAGEHICMIPVHGACDPNAEESFCAENGVCEDQGDGAGACMAGRGGACDPASDDCAQGLECAELVSGGNACWEPVQLVGRVFDLVSDVGIEGAHVIALDELGSAVTDVAVSATDGAYSLDIPVVRQDSGAPAQVWFTLRSSAQSYETFPSGLRTALPIDASSAQLGDNAFVIQTALTDIGLIALPPALQGLPSISGQVLAGDQSSGVLVVAESAGPGITAISDMSGSYTIFNVPDGPYQVRGYAADLQLVPVDVNMAGADLVDVNLEVSSEALTTITGSVQIVNAPGGSVTSVVLVVASTFDNTFVRGEIPRGLRAPKSGPPDVSTGGFTIEGVPDGDYYVLAAFENDDLVRDPDDAIAGTDIVFVSVDSTNLGTTIDIQQSFKITEALAVFYPGADTIEEVIDVPIFSWADDASEAFYTFTLYNALGELVWEDPLIDSVSGSPTVDYPYPGTAPALVNGMYYQFKAISWRTQGQNTSAASATEDLRGVFVYTGP